MGTVVVSELVCNNTDELVVVEVFDRKRTDDEDVSSASEGIDVGTLVNGQNEPAAR